MVPRLLNRLFWSAATLLATAVLTFFLIHGVPGDPARVIAGAKATPEVLAQIREHYHLNDPLLSRLGHYLRQIASGDLGQSYVTGEPVRDALLSRLPVTAALAGLAVVLWMGLAVPLGVLSARHRGSRFDRLVLVIATVTLSLPAFWLARMVQYWVAYRLGWFPVAGFHGFASLLLPAISLAILYFGFYARLLHGTMIEALESPYIRAARAKGASEFSVLFRHGLRNALIPVLTVLAMDVASLLGGVLFVENVFGLPGIGTLAVQSVFNLDVPIIMGTVLFAGAIVITANLLMDLLYQFLDPRIRGGW